jgi:iron complex transport system substrate-binding protein
MDRCARRTGRAVRDGREPGKCGHRALLTKSTVRAVVAPLALIGLVAFLGLAVERYAAPPGGLQLPPLTETDGRSSFQLGSLEYPRFATDADGFRVRVPRPSYRIASQHWAIDDYLYCVVPPERVVAVSTSSYQQQYSNVYPLVMQFHPVISTDPERVLRTDPDLVLVSSNGRADLTSLVRSSGVPVYRVQTMFRTLSEVEDTTRLIGYLTGEDEKAKQVVNRFRSEVEEARALRPKNAAHPRILGLGGNSSYGQNTLFNDIVEKLGGINVAAEGGLEGYTSVNFEQVARWNPDWIITGADKGKAQQTLARLMSNPAIALTNAARQRQMVVLDSRVFLPLSPFSGRLVRAIAEALYRNQPEKNAG